MSRRTRPALLLSATAVVVALVAGGCGTGSDTGTGTGTAGADSASSGPSTGAAGVSYVALGDSYASAPGLPTQDPSSGACARSLDNYAHLLAAADPSLQLDDQTCSGATSDDVLNRQMGTLSADTDLVTLGIGGNDEGLFVSVVANCVQLSFTDPTGSPCTDASAARVKATLTTIEANVTAVVAKIGELAPNAQVVVVGYPQVLPTDGTCPALVPIAAGDFAFVNAMNRGLSNDLKSAADAGGADYVDVYAASAGHDICSAEPWVNGAETAANGVIPFHPFAAEQQAVATMVSGLLS